MNRTSTMILFPLGLCASILAILFFLVLPTVHDVNIMRNDLTIEQTRLEERYRQGLLLKRLRDDWEKIQAQVGVLDTAIVRYDTSIPLITRLESLASENAVTHRLTLPLPEKKDTGKSVSVPFTFQWQGSWSSLMHMLVAVEREPYYLPIETIRVVSKRADTPAFFTRSAPSLPLVASPEKESIDMTFTGTTIWSNE